jgi:hypothetical protein
VLPDWSAHFDAGGFLLDLYLNSRCNCAMCSLQSISRGNAEGSCRSWALTVASSLAKMDAEEQAVLATSGMFNEAMNGIDAFAARGTEGLADANHQLVYMSLQIIMYARDQPGCEARIRAAAAALAFCLDYSLDVCPEMGRTTGGEAALLCCGIFGRDEGGSEFTFTSAQVDTLVTKWSQRMRPMEG